ncbi:unnamed protein product [Soboliphyme baturini]|uniref:Activin_recp domain-containing protein n=1 Tax=Soboliphyme baturini TaxID=241478 RepID=A0A183J1I8_9BILA|nr:unnamed protein product [Soboliphyme baturini]
MSDSGRRLIAVELCDSKCVTLKETKLINGLVIGYNVIRGCLTTMFRWNPMNRYSLEIIAGKSKGRCQELSASDLMPSLSKVKVHSNPVTLCSCLGDLCNGEKSFSCSINCLLLCLIIAFTFFS